MSFKRRLRRGSSLSDILEVKVAVEPANLGREGDEELGEGRVHVHEEHLADVLGRKAAKVDFIEPARQLILRFRLRQLTHTTEVGQLSL